MVQRSVTPLSAPAEEARVPRKLRLDTVLPARGSVRIAFNICASSDRPLRARRRRPPSRLSKFFETFAAQKFDGARAAPRRSCTSRRLFLSVEFLSNDPESSLSGISREFGMRAISNSNGSRTSTKATSWPRDIISCNLVAEMPRTVEAFEWLQNCS